jgi:hypothetical protein
MEAQEHYSKGKTPPNCAPNAGAIQAVVHGLFFRLLAAQIRGNYFTMKLNTTNYHLNSSVPFLA